MNLKDHFLNDIDTVFNNIDELGELANINGAMVTIVQDEEKLMDRITQDYDGLVVGDILFFISTSELKKVPRIQVPILTGSAMSFKGKPCTVIKAIRNYGMFEIQLKYAGGMQ